MIEFAYTVLGINEYRVDTWDNGYVGPRETIKTSTVIAIFTGTNACENAIQYANTATHGYGSLEVTPVLINPKPESYVG